MGVIVLLAVAAFTLASRAGANPSPGSLQAQLDRLNLQADQLVEQYLQAQLALQQTHQQLAALQPQADRARARLAVVRRQIGAQAAASYMSGPAAGIGMLLNSSSADQSIDRVQALNTLARQNGALLAEVRTADELTARVAESLRTLERKQAAQLASIARKRAQVQQAVAKTQRLLAQMGAASRAAQAPQAAPATIAGASAAAQAAVRYAYAQLGKPYVFGASGPRAFDCSGLTMMAWRQGGLSLPHSSGAQYGIGRHVSRAELRPGDLIFRNSPISHVAMYVGGGMQIAATHSGSDVKLQPAFTGNIVGYSRPTG